MPENMRGDILHPLNELKELRPDLYAETAKKYEGRESIMGHRIPPLGCLWNDVVHLSAIHPSEIKRELKKYGRGGMLGDFYEIDPYLLEQDKTVVYLYQRTRSKESLPIDDFVAYDPVRVIEYVHL
ncbi:MAG TPA: hypothetical protein VJ837_03305, partial [Candidatus Paceibacterota bacterium]|nr:hypothetical protein [Candidatus Paceibacterota bacterium]